MIAIVDRACYKVQPTEMVGVMDMMSIPGVKEVMKSAPASKYNPRQAYPAREMPAVAAGKMEEKGSDSRAWGNWNLRPVT